MTHGQKQNQKIKGIKGIKGSVSFDLNSLDDLRFEVARRSFDNARLLFNLSPGCYSGKAEGSITDSVLSKNLGQKLMFKLAEMEVSIFAIIQQKLEIFIYLIRE
ncbi:MAG: hypothetical protein DRR06_11630 [Gammaproteobacteria bacterium]|nr:MAG: hypothetical protein DRR06_11630 [Gammaproteobacteria bacterium]